MSNRYFVLAALLALLRPLAAQAQQPCTTTNAGGCGCRDGSQDCDLLPDMTLSWDALLHYLGGPNEHAQTGNGIENGRLNITSSSPNIGYGSLTVRGTNWYVCGTDTFQSVTTPGACPDGTTPRQLIHQRVYHKNGSQMTFYDRFAGAMTYHPTHGHNHVDDWCVFTLRLRDSTKADPRQWPIVGTGAKVGFCLMDYYSCTDPNANGHCRDNNAMYLQGTPLNTYAQFPNYGLGGGQYNCSPIEQGISSGYTDVYSERLDGMWINVPPSTCNGQYWVVMEVDPHNFFLEENENNNVSAAPVTLTNQRAVGNGTVEIRSNAGTMICQGESLTLTADPALRYRWSTGDSTQNITITQPGTYSVEVDNYCGHVVSRPFTVTVAPPAPAAPTAQGAAICAGATATLTATGTGTMQWLDGQGHELGRGNTFTTPTLTQNATYYVKALNLVVDSVRSQPANNLFATGSYLNGSTQGLILTTHQDITLASCTMYAQNAGARTIELRNDYGLTVATRVVNLAAGANRVNLNLPIPMGVGWRLIVNSTNNNTPGLFRNSAGTTYPIVVPGVWTITGNTGQNAADYYYFFYDCKLETTQSACGSAPVAVNVAVSNTPATIDPLAPTYTTNATPVTLIGTPAGGTFSGPGVMSGVFYPSVAGVGGPYTITYSYTNAQGCTSTATVQTVVSATTGLAAEATDGLSVVPNPAHDHFSVQLANVAPTGGTLELRDLLGRVVVRRTLAATSAVNAEISVANLPTGTYVLTVAVGGRHYARQVVVN